MTGTWWPARRRLAAIAVPAAVIVGMGAAVLGGAGSGGTLAVVSGGVALAALLAPAGVTVWVVWGLWMAWSTLGAAGDGSPFMAVVIVAGVVVVAELLSEVAWMDTPIEPAGDGMARRVGLAATVAAGVGGTVLVLGGVWGLTGVLAVGIGSAACAGVAWVLVRPGVVRRTSEGPSSFESR